MEYENKRHELEVRKQTEVETIRQQTEKARLEGYRLSHSRGSRVDPAGQSPGPGVRPFDIGNLWLVPPFNEKDPDSFFVLFERVSRARGWSDAYSALMLQCVLTGKTQEAYSSLSLEDSASYAKVKTAILRAYELVPEAYRQRFRSWERRNGQTHVEFARDLSTHFKRWLTALNISTFDDLSELIILEQFKNVLPGRIATYINEKNVTSAADAAVAADEFVLLHKGGGRERTPA